MEQGDYAELVMKKVLCKDMTFDQKKYLCKIFRYEPLEECIYLILENDSLTDISLDAIYECSIYDKTSVGNKTVSSGYIKERFSNKFGKILKFQIKNGFYKISVKSVDK